MLDLTALGFPAQELRELTSISTSKCPALHKNTPSFIFLICSSLITLLEPVHVTKTSPNEAKSDNGLTSNPSMCASRALIGSISLTDTIAPIPRALTQTPLPTQP